MIAALMCGGETALPTTFLAAMAAVVAGSIVSWHRKRLQLLKSLHSVAMHLSALLHRAIASPAS